MEAENLMNRLMLNISMLKRCNKGWTRLMKDLKGEAKATDEKECTEGDEGFIKAIIAGNEAVAGLNALFLKKCDKLNLKY